MFKVIMMMNKVEGYKTVGYANTLEEAQEKIKALKIYHSPIDVYYCYN